MEAVASIASDLTTAVAVLVGGVWAVVHFWKRRDLSPKIDLTASLDFFGAHGSEFMVEIQVQLENLGALRHKVSDLVYSLRILRDDDPVVSDDRILGQVSFPHPVAERRRLFPSEWGYSFVDPGVKNTYRSVTTIPRDARFVLVSCRFTYGDRESDFHVSQRVLPVPRSA